MKGAKMTFFEALTLVLMVLKLTGEIGINWFIVIAPILVEYIIVIWRLWGESDD